MWIAGGIIRNNTAKTNGGGIYVGKWSVTCTLVGGEIQGNRAQYGGGVYCGETSTVIMSEGIVSGNEAKYVGGGVYILDGSLFIQIGGRITGNAAEDGGEDLWYDPEAVSGTGRLREIEAYSAAEAAFRGTAAWKEMRKEP